jgi:hypothetical protein
MNAAGNYSQWVLLLISSGSKKEKKRPNWEFSSLFGGKYGRKETVVFQSSDHPASRVAALIQDQVQTLALAREELLVSET